MALPTVTFPEGSELENSLANYLSYLGKQVACGFYQNRRFLILSKPLPHFGRSVYIPDLKFSQSFWAEAKKYTENDFVFKFPQTQKSNLELLRSADLTTKPESLEKIKKGWQKVEKQFFKTCQDFFPLFDFSKINAIACTVSPFGTQGSFEFQKQKNGKIDLRFTHRQDISPSGIAEKILSELVNLENPMMSLGEWEIRESIVDFLLMRTKLGQIFNFDFQPTVRTLPELSENLILESEAFCQKLGFPIKPIFSNGLDPLSEKRFTQTEKRILLHLVSNRNKTVSYDEIGNQFWGEEESLEKFSLASIAKIMEKIRKKIKENGINQELIYTVRNQGYVLYN